MRQHNDTPPCLDDRGARLHVGDAVRYTRGAPYPCTATGGYLQRVYAAVECDNDNPHDCPMLVEVLCPDGGLHHMQPRDVHFTGHPARYMTERQAGV